MDAYVFISHKHSDAKIAETVADFVKERTLNKVGIYDSSSSKFEGPRVGKNLNDELKKALAKTDIVLLIYTNDDEDWQYCMWECGIAIDPWDQHPTRVVVLQCGSNAPKPLADTTRVDVRNKEEVIGFTKQFLTDETFFPLVGGKISDFHVEDPVLEKFGQELYDDLAAVIPAAPAGSASDLASSTFLRIELPADSIAVIESAPIETRRHEVADALRDHGAIIENDRAKALFGFEIATTTTVGKVLNAWEATFPGQNPIWFESLAEQIDLAISQKYPDGVPWAPYKAGRGRSVIPYVSRSRRTASANMQFDTYFIPVAAAPVPVSARMIPMSEAFHKRLDKSPGAEILLTQLVDEMDHDERTRVPVLGDGGKARYIIHRSMIDRFIAKYAMSGKSVGELKLADLLNEADMKELFAHSFAIVAPETRLSDAKIKMNEIKDAQDVLVTQDGTSETAVLGWLTNTMFV
jgi:hypothetical protein